MRNFKETVYYVESINGHMDDLNSDLNENLGKLNGVTGPGLIFGNRAGPYVGFISRIYTCVCYIVNHWETQYGSKRRLGAGGACN